MSEIGRLSDVGHLTPEVVAALVDGELTRRAEHRARIHLVHCVECRDEVRAQRQAAEMMRDAMPTDDIHVSGSLLSRLTRIPDDCAGGEGLDEADTVDGDMVGIDGCRRPASLTGRVAAAARKVQRKSSRKSSIGWIKSPRPRAEG